jgi:hypothetical protein
MLFADYVTTQATSAYPNGRVLSPTEGPGLVYTTGPSNPVAGADWTFLIPTNCRQRIRSIHASFVTAAAVANRNIRVIVQDVGGTAFRAAAAVSVPASTGALVSMSSVPVYTPIDPLTIPIPLPADLVLTGATGLAMNVTTNTVNIQAADQWSTIRFLVEEWLDNV